MGGSIVTPSGAAYERERAIEFVVNLPPDRRAQLRAELTGPMAHDFDWRPWWRASPPVPYMAGLMEALRMEDPASGGTSAAEEEAPQDGQWHVCDEACSFETAEIDQGRSVEVRIHRAKDASIDAVTVTMATLDGSTTLRLSPEGWEAFQALVKKAGER